MGGKGMKRLICAIAILTAVAGCARNSEQTVPVRTVKAEITATASMVKGVLEQDQFFKWAPGDRILVELSDGSFSTFETSEGGECAVFSGQIPEGTKPGGSAFYPADIVTVKGKEVSFAIGPKINGGEKDVLIPMAGRRWGGETFAFRAVAGAVKIMIENVPDEFGDSGKVIFSATEATSGIYALDPKTEKLVWDASIQASSLEIDVKVDRGRGITCYVPLPENDNWGRIHIALKGLDGKTYMEKDVPEGTVVPVKSGRVTRIPPLSFPSGIITAINPTDSDFSIWDNVPDLTETHTFTPWTWRSSWKGEDVYSTEDFNIVCKHVKFFSDSNYLYGYLYLDTTIPHNLSESLQHFYVMLDNDDETTGQSFGGNNIAEVPLYRGYNIMLYGTACTNGVPGVWKPAMYDCTVDAGASNTNISGTVINGVADAGYGGGSFNGDIFEWEFAIDRGKTGLSGRSHTNICVAFCSGTNSPYLIMPSIHGIELDLVNE